MFWKGRKVAELEIKISELESANEVSKSALKSSHNDYFESLTELKRLKESYDESAKSNELLADSCRSLERDKKRLKQDLEKNMSEYKAETIAFENLVNDFDEVSAKNIELMKENSGLKRKNDALTKKVADLQKKANGNDVLAAKAKEVDKKFSETKAANDALVTVKPSRYVSEEEAQSMRDMYFNLKGHYSYRDVAKKFGRSMSTVRRHCQ